MQSCRLHVDVISSILFTDIEHFIDDVDDDDEGFENFADDADVDVHEDSSSDRDRCKLRCSDSRM